MPPFVLKLDAKKSRATCPKARGRLGVRKQHYLKGKGILLLSALQKGAQSMCDRKQAVVLSEASGNEAWAVLNRD